MGVCGNLIGNQFENAGILNIRRQLAAQILRSTWASFANAPSSRDAGHEGTEYTVLSTECL